MAIKLALLKSGEEVVADVKELVFESKVVGYVFNNPVTITYLNPEVLMEGGSSLNMSFQIWNPLAKDRNIPVAPDWVVTLVDPIDQIITLYTTQLAKGNDGGTNNEESDNQSDAGSDSTVVLKE